MLKGKILIVEDELLVAKELEECLKSNGHTVAGCATSGEEACALLKETLPDLILMDIVLQGKIDGIEAARAITSEFGIPIIFISAYSERELVRRAKMTSPIAFIAKPFHSDELLTIIDFALESHRTKQQLKEIEHEYTQVIESLHDAIIRLDENHRITYVNKRFTELTGRTLDELQGRLPHDFFRTEEQKTFFSEQLRKRKEGINESYPFIFDLEKGNTIHVRITPRALFDSRGKFRGSIGIITDITNQKVAEDELQMLKDKMDNIINSSGGIGEETERFDVTPEINCHGLTSREKEVLCWLRHGKSAWEIGEILKISENTVKFHVRNILRKLNAVSRTQAVAIAFETGILTGKQSR